MQLVDKGNQGRVVDINAVVLVRTRFRIRGSERRHSRMTTTGHR